MTTARTTPERLIPALSYRVLTLLYIQLPIAKALLRGCIPIMDLVGMQHHHLAWCADLRGASIVEGLDARGRQADRIGVVAVLVIGLPLKPCLEEFYPVVRLGTLYPILSAQSFKTNAAVFAMLLNHT